MKKIIIIILIILLIGGGIFVYSGVLDKFRIKGVIKGAEKAMEQEEIYKLMSYVSLKYMDDYGFNYPMVKRLVADLFKDFDKFDVSIKNPVVEIKDDTATVKFDVWVAVDWNGNPAYIVGTNRSAAHIRAFLTKEFLNWKVVKVEGVR